MPDGDGDSEGVDSSSSTSGRSKSSGSSNWRKAASAAGKSLSESGAAMMSDSGRSITPVQYKRGGKVRKTGPAIVHKDERVIPRGKRKAVEKLMRKKKMRMKARS